MPNKAAMFSSEYLTKDQMHSALIALPGVLLSLVGEYPIIAMYGWASHLHTSLLWTPMGADTRSLQYLIEDSLDPRIVVPGESDFIFEVPEKRMEVVFCHQSDIHLDGTDDALLQQFMTSEPYRHICWYTRAEVEKMIS